MAPQLPEIHIDYLRKQTLGYCYQFDTPYGHRLMTYADYIASGRNLKFVELYLLGLQEGYANTHTEDDITGKQTTELLHQAECSIKEAVGGNAHTQVIAAGTGATGAIHTLQKILGVYIPPATHSLLDDALESFRDQELDDSDSRQFDTYRAAFERWFNRHQPLVIIGPYEHHSNEVTWRECLAEVQRVRMSEQGNVDMQHLEQLLKERGTKGRKIIGSFSAASNVTGMKAPVHDIAELLHDHGGIACFDYAASAPYVPIHMNPDENRKLDAVFISPHKFLGGPGACGLLLFDDRLYRSDLPPTCGGGGTVDYVGPDSHDFVASIEEREKAGTPGTLQLIRAALALEIKNAIGADRIESIEHDYISAAMQRLGKNPDIDILGSDDPDARLSILSFNIRHGERILHPKFVTRLLNDLFGIQSRAGCSCAGPYGHTLLNIGPELSKRYRNQIVKGYNGIKPGWVRVGFHFTLDQISFDFLCQALEFIAEYGHLFLQQYCFNLHSGTWTHQQDNSQNPTFSLAAAIEGSQHLPKEDRQCDLSAEFESYLAEARERAEKLETSSFSYGSLSGELEELRFFEFVLLEDEQV